MKISRLIVFSLVIILLGSLSVVTGNAQEPDTAKGTMTANGKKYDIKYSYADNGPDDVIVVLSDSALSRDNIPFGLHQLSMEGKVHGIVFTVSKQSKELATGLNAIYDESWEGQLGTIGNAVLKIDKFDDQIIQGRIHTPEENSFSDYTYSFDVTFSASLAKPADEPPAEISIKGDDTPPAAAYAAYHKALMNGDVPKLKELIVKDHAEQLDSEEAEMFLEFAKSTRPAVIDISTKESSDASAEGTGTVEMVVEDGNWKVSTDKWKFGD